MRILQVLVVLGPLLAADLASAEVIGSAEPFVSDTVLDIGPLEGQALDVKAAFARRLFACGVVDEVEQVLASERVTTTIDDRNTHFEISAGGFAGGTNPTFGYRVTDTGANAASHDDILLLTNSLGYVLSQDSAFLLDTVEPTSFDFPSNFLVLNFPDRPTLAESAATFEAVGRIDPSLFETDSSGYTQVGRSYFSLQSDVPDAEFIAGYVAAAEEVGAAYTPIVNGAPSLLQGGVAFPGNDWGAHPRGEEYLARLPVRIHPALRRLRAHHLELTRKVLRKLQDHANHRELLAFVRELGC